MSRNSLGMLAVALLIMGVGAGWLAHLRGNQRLGPPGVKTSPIPDSIRLRVDLPEAVLDYESERVETDQLVLDTLPKDTSFGQRRYTAPDRFQTMVNVVLMGTDRTSLHKPEFCLSGQGWKIDEAASAEAKVRIEGSQTYDLPVMKFVSTKEATIDGQSVVARGIYVFWFVDGDRVTARHWQRMVWMAGGMLRTGVLQRWAYVSCFSVCAPGQEEPTFERMKRFIAAAVPQFQSPPLSEAPLRVADGR